MNTAGGSESPANAAAAEQLLDAYRLSLADDCDRLPVSFWESAVKLSELYVPPDVTSPPRPAPQEAEQIWKWRLVQGQPAGRMLLLDALAHDRRRRHVLVGASGSGKSTFANYLCRGLAARDPAFPPQWLELIPLRLCLRDVSTASSQLKTSRGSARLLWETIELTAARRFGRAGLATEIERNAATRGVFAVFDGFDEIPEFGGQRQIVLEAILEFVARLGRGPSQFLITARPTTYLDLRRDFKGFERMTLAPFDQTQVSDFSRRWFHAVAPRLCSSNPATADQQMKSFSDAVSTRPHLRDLVTRPLFLHALALLHSRDQQLPDSRIEAYQAMVELLLQSAGRSQLNLGLAARAAYERHAGAVDPSSSAFDDVSLAAAHDYLVGWHLSNLPNSSDTIRQRLAENHDWWHEPCLLAIERAKGGDEQSLLAEVLRGDPPTDAPTAAHWHVARVCTQAAMELQPADAVADRLRRWLIALITKCRLPPQDLLEAGDLLGRFGDPRRGTGIYSQQHADTTATGLPEIDWVEIPAGPFLMGTVADEHANKAETPLHEVVLERYWIARYPVTNAQFRAFVEEDGYSNPAYWTDAGWNWRQGEAVDLSVYQIEPSYREALAIHVSQRTADKHDRPSLWDDKRWSAPTRPVVGITWYEAHAFAKWLTHRYRQAGVCDALHGDSSECAVTLPTEAQWEMAARGADARQWPWGATFERDYCNSLEMGLDETTPVGIFAGNRSPSGVADMAGNVWEWTSTIWDPERFSYPYQSDDGREDPTGPQPRVIRGGSFYQHAGFARCAARIMTAAGDFRNSIGFRVVLT